MNFAQENEKERSYYRQDFSVVAELLHRIRKSLFENIPVASVDLNFDGIFEFNPNLNFMYLTLFQSGLEPLRWGSLKPTLDATLNRITDKIRNSKEFKNFNLKDCRIMLEFITEETPVKIEDITVDKFLPTRFEPGITGFKLIFEGNSYYYMPTESWTKSQNSLKQSLNTIIRKTSLKKVTNKISERINLLRKSDYKCFLIKSRAFVTYMEDGVLPLYRGNVLYEYSDELVGEMALNSVNWLVDTMREDGRFLYYYDCKEDNYKDHEHPTRTEDNLYYNDLRHCGGVISLIRAYQLTGEDKYLKLAKKGLEYITTITREHKADGEVAAYVFLNNKAKLGGTGLILVAMMKYRIETGEKTFDEYIKKYVRHLLSRIYKTGEMLGYFINPNVQNGAELYEMTDEERKATFSFYYPGEALLGLALFANYFGDDSELVKRVMDKCEMALDWLVKERPKIYGDLFTALPSDSWLMQAIEEWVNNPRFKKDSYINFVFTDANAMMDRMYLKDDSPYIDFEGGFYYNHGDHYYPDGARCEGLISSYYLAKKLEREELAQKILSAAKKAAKSQFVLYNSDKNNYAHKNPKKSERAIRFKATRQWVRVDSIQHVACFFFRLYSALKNV